MATLGSGRPGGCLHSAFAHLAVYVSALWFGSLWILFSLLDHLQTENRTVPDLCAAHCLILRGAFWLLERGFAAYATEKRTIVVITSRFNSLQHASPGLSRGCLDSFCVDKWFAIESGMREFGLYLRQPSTGLPDPIFGKPLGFYLFSLPVYDALSSWLISLAFIILCVTLLYSLLALPQKVLKSSALPTGTAIVAISLSVAFFLLLLAAKTYLARFPYIWEDHQTFTGVTYAEANYLLPALLLVSVALIIAAANLGFQCSEYAQNTSPFAGPGLPVITYILGVVAVPAYVTSFIVKPKRNRSREPIHRTQHRLDQASLWSRWNELRDFAAENSVESTQPVDQSPNLGQYRLWDWQALRDTLKQIQAIRTYYDFSDVDVDRYRVGDDAPDDGRAA